MAESHATNRYIFSQKITPAFRTKIKIQLSSTAKILPLSKIVPHSSLESQPHIRPVKLVMSGALRSQRRCDPIP